MPFSPTATNTVQRPTRTMLQPYQHPFHRQSTETLQSVASSCQSNTSSRLRCPTSIPPITNTTEHYSPSTSNPPPRHVLNQHRFNRYHTPSPPPMRDLPALRTTDEAVHGYRSLVDADQLEESSPDAELTLESLDFSLGRLSGFPYCMGVSDAMEQRSRALAEAEELDYQRSNGWKPKLRLSGRVESALKGLSLHNAVSRTRLGR